jgi:D-alanyl-D-alanine carboxypeptidase/D-alanyl-D-alanine-endopeptidase (penicillin-binding protein 4)
VVQLRRDLHAVFDAPVMAHARWGVVVRSLDHGELLYEKDADRLMMPASNMKIVTLAAAAQILGWDHRFATVVETDGRIERGVLHGDLLIRGGGDPTINTRNGRGAAVFEQWLASLKAAGIERIDGRIVGDDQLFDDDTLGAGWAWDYLEAGYAAPIGALQYNEDVVPLNVLPGERDGAPAVVTLGAHSGLALVNRATTSAGGMPETLVVRRHLDKPLLEVAGTVPLRVEPPEPVLTPARTVPRQIAVLNPTLFFVQSFKDFLMERGLPVSGDAVDADEIAAAAFAAPTDPSHSRRVLTRTESPPLREIAPVLMKVSHNLYAETLLKAIGVAATAVGTARAGREAALRVLQAWNIDGRGLVMADGSGLSRYNYVTPALLGRVLERMYSDARHRDPFYASLPVAGKDGTMSTRMRRTRAEGNAVAKTGSISNVRSLSGYVRTRDRELLVFSIVANDFVVPAATVNWIADLAVEVLSNFSRN